MYLLNVGCKINIPLLILLPFCFLLIINPIMQTDTTHNPIIQLAVETTAIINGAESVAGLTVALVVL